jgi:hypothetical protein
MAELGGRPGMSSLLVVMACLRLVVIVMGAPEGCAQGQHAVRQQIRQRAASEN